MRGIRRFTSAMKRLARSMAGCPVRRRTERAEPMGVGRRDLDERDVDGQRSTHEGGNLAEEYRNEIRGPVLDGGPRVRAHEERPVPDVPLERGRDVRCIAEREHVPRLDVAQVRGSSRERFHESSRRPAPDPMNTRSPSPTSVSAAASGRALSVTSGKVPISD